MSDLSIFKSPKKDLAIAAASQATEAAAELLRFAREGEGHEGAFETEVVRQLLDATKLAIECLSDEEGCSFVDIYRDLKHELEFWI